MAKHAHEQLGIAMKEALNSVGKHSKDVESATEAERTRALAALPTSSILYGMAKAAYEAAEVEVMAAKVDLPPELRERV